MCPHINKYAIICTHTYTTQTGELNLPTHLTVLLNNSVITLSWNPPDRNSSCIVKFMIYISGEIELQWQVYIGICVLLVYTNIYVHIYYIYH